MGLFLSKLYDLFSSFSGSNPTRVLMLGLDAAGKSTVVYKIKLNKNVCTIPTIGFNVETVSPVKGVTFTVWDVGGQDKIRPLWRYYLQNTEGLLYVVDSNDRERMAEAKEELFGILENDEMRGVPVVVMANKQDLPNAMGTSQVADALGLSKLTGRKWFIHGTCATTGEGIFESMSEMAKVVKEKQKDAMDIVEIEEALCLRSIGGRDWFSCGTSTITGEGIKKSMVMMAKFLKKRRKKKD